MKKISTGADLNVQINDGSITENSRFKKVLPTIKSQINKKDSINFSKLYSKNIKKFRKFISTHWKKNHIFNKNNKLFNWQYKNKNNYNFFIAENSGNLIGIQGFVPLNHFDKNLNKKDVFLSFWRVIEDKHIGIGFKLQEEIVKKYKPKFLGVIRPHAETHNFFRWLGFRVEKMDHHVLLSNFVNKFKIAKVKKFKIIYKLKKENISLVKLNAKNIKILLKKNFYKVQIPMKSNNYIVNRYLKHPYYNYLPFLIMNKKKPEALMVIRPIKVNNSLVLRLVDFIGTEKSFLLTYEASIKLLKKYNAEYIDIYSYGISKKIFKEAGYINRNEEKDLVIPTNFEPFQRKNIDIYCAFKSNYSNKVLRLFKGDGDGDRTNILKTTK